MRNFRKLEIWNVGIEIALEVYKLSELFPKEEKFGLTSQIHRAAISIPSNIAEDCDRNSEIEFKRFLEISLGSAFELETQLLIIEKLNLISSEKLVRFKALLTHEQKQINTLITKLKPKANSQWPKVNTQKIKSHTLL